MVSNDLRESILKVETLLINSIILITNLDMYLS